MLLLPWFVVAGLVLFPDGFHRPAAGVGVPPPSTEYSHQCRPGPWGDLRYSRIVVEPPQEFISSDLSSPDAVLWVFVGYTQARLSDLWHTAGLSAAQIRTLSAPAAVETRPNAIVIKPTTALVLGLSTAARAKIYSALSLFPENPDQNEPFRFRADAADEWFENSELPPAILALVRRMLYRRGTSLLFSDHDVILPLIPAAADRIRLVRMLARKSTLLARLHVRPDSDLDTLAEYWGRGPRRKGIRALLQSLSQHPGGMTIDIAHLLPRFARSHLFTYPQASDHPDDDGHDCHWSALNFFNDPPDERLADPAFVKQTLENDYAPVVGRPLLGDVLTFARPDGKIIHSCVYIADDIVFTKNGGSPMMPFILMSISDVIAFYPAEPPLTIRVFRRKDL